MKQIHDDKMEKKSIYQTKPSNRIKLYKKSIEIHDTVIKTGRSLPQKKLDDGWPESERGKDVDVKYKEERRRCEKISEERMKI